MGEKADLISKRKDLKDQLIHLEEKYTEVHKKQEEKKQKWILIVN